MAGRMLFLPGPLSEHTIIRKTQKEYPSLSRSHTRKTHCNIKRRKVDTSIKKIESRMGFLWELLQPIDFKTLAHLGMVSCIINASVKCALASGC